jgi:hypothetical protein
MAGQSYRKKEGERKGIAKECKGARAGVSRTRSLAPVREASRFDRQMNEAGELFPAETDFD